MIVGFLWYGPLFGKIWMRLSEITPDPAKAKEMGLSYFLTFIGSLAMSYILSQFMVVVGAYSDVARGLMVGFLSWLGFVAPVTLGTVLWEGKSWRLWILNNGHYLVALLVMGAVLGALM